MVAKFRKVVQVGVDLVRGAATMVASRHVPDLAVMSLSAAMHDASLTLADFNIAPHPESFAAVTEAVFATIVSLGGIDMRGDVSALEAITDPVSLAICTKQLEMVDRLHLLTAVVLGVEKGLRELVAAAPVSKTHQIRDGPQLSEKRASSTLKNGSTPPEERRVSRTDSAMAPTAQSNLFGGTGPIMMDTDDL